MLSVLIDKPCKGCGVIMRNVDSRRVYCNDCSARRNAEGVMKSKSRAPRYDKPCEMCGEMMYGVVSYRRFCPKCSLIRSKKRNKVQRPSGYHVGQLYNIPCVICGTMMYGVHGAKQYCPACLKMRVKLRKKGEFPPVIEVLKQTAKPGHAPKNHSLNEDALNADREGLSYGYYILKHGLF